MRYLTLKAFVEQMQRFEEIYGGDIPVLLADKDSPNVMCPVIDSFVIDIVDEETSESQRIVLVSNLVDDVTRR